MRHRLISEIPAVDEYIELRRAAGLSVKTQEAARRGLPQSLFAVCIRRNESLIGMGRIVGDSGCNFEVVDVAVHPDFQRLGIGYQIMSALMGFLKANAPSSAYVSLIADGEATKLYQKFGFEMTAPASVGMAWRP